MKNTESVKRLLMAMGMAWALGAQAQTVDGGIYVAGPNNGLTPSQIKNGYVLLWNGKDFTGWKTFNASSPADNWTVVKEAGEENGAKKSLSADSNVIEVVKSGESIWTIDTTFQNFDWLVEWQTTVTESQNGGLLYRYSEKANHNNNGSAPEYQVCNNLWTSEWNKPIETAGAIYELKPLMPARINLDQSPNWTRASGHWNQSRIICFNGHIAHYGNGLRLAEDQMLTPDWNARYKASKYSSFPYFATIHPGSFFLQDHGQTHVKYRSVRVKRLTDNPWGPKSPYLNKVAAAAGDSTLIDTLTFATDLFPVDGSGTMAPFAIAPKMEIRTAREGITVFLSRPGEFSVRLNDIRGAALPVRSARLSDRIFIPAGQAHGPRVLSIWNDGRKIQEEFLGLR
ncbi:MAG: hypothetical protein JWO30_1649 [Fibrobacteres bacterium]|nr:hypothetical protein [Fibrobacterota bacterium]